MTLNGRRIAVTRAAEQAEELVAALEAEGAVARAFPLIRVRAVDDQTPLEAALRDGGFDWVVFTSANAVRFCAQAAERAAERVGLAPEDTLERASAERPERAERVSSALAACLGTARIACVGPATAAAARDASLVVDVIPETYTGDDVAPALVDAGMSAGARVLWPHSAQARRVLGDALVGRGVRLTDVVAYETEPDREQARALADALLQKSLDMVIFTSPSTVNSLHAVLPALPDVQVAVIGPVTAAAARAVGYPVDIMPSESTVGALVSALVTRSA